MLRGETSSVEVREISDTSASPRGGDIFMHVKRHQSDSDPYLVQCLMSETRAREIEHRFVQPAGLAFLRTTH